MTNGFVLEPVPAQRGKYELICKKDGAVLHRDLVDPRHAVQRKKFIDHIFEKDDSLDVDWLEKELIDLPDAVQTSESGKKESDSHLNDLLTGEELEINQIARPELITQEDFSAIAIPRCVDAKGRVLCGWVQYVQEPNRRLERPLDVDCLITPSGQRLYLSPSLSDPEPTDVCDLGRWSAASRKEWLEGKAPPSTADLIERIAERIDAHVFLDPKHRVPMLYTLASWVMMTYAFRSLEAVPYLYLGGPANSGKTTLMDVLASLSWRPVRSSSMRGPTLFRSMDQKGGTLFLDEAEQLRSQGPESEMLAQMLQAGYKKGGRASRCEGDSHRVMTFDVYGPKVLGCIRGLPPALATRCIEIRMSRAPKGEKRAAKRLDCSESVHRDLLDDLHIWALEHAHQAVTQELGGLDIANRDAELWHPLLSIVKYSGDDVLLTELQEFAKVKAESGKKDNASEAGPIFLRSLYELRTRGEIPTAQQILDHARFLQPGYFDSAIARGVASALGNYDIKSSSSNGRKLFRAELKDIEEIASRYEYDLPCDEGNGDE